MVLNEFIPAEGVEEHVAELGVQAAAEIQEDVCVSRAAWWANCL